MCPIPPDKEHDKAGYDIRDGDVGKEVGPLNVADGEHRENITVCRGDVLDVVDGVDGYEHGAPEQRDATEQDPRHAGET